MSFSGRMRRFRIREREPITCSRNPQRGPLVICEREIVNASRADERLAEAQDVKRLKTGELRAIVEAEELDYGFGFVLNCCDRVWLCHRRKLMWR